MNFPFIVVGIINLVLITVLGILVVQIRIFVREAEDEVVNKQEKILHPLLDFDQIRSIPNLRDIEILLLAIIWLLILYTTSLLHLDGEPLAVGYPHWWIAFEVAGFSVFCHSLLRYTRHMVDRDRTDWHRTYDLTRDFLWYRIGAFAVVGGTCVWMFFSTPAFEFPDNHQIDSQPDILNAYQFPVVILRLWLLFAFLNLLNWVLRTRGELVSILKTISILLGLAGVIGVWGASFLFDRIVEAGEIVIPWAFSPWVHVCYTLVFLALILLLFKDNMILLGATHRAAQIIAEEKKVMVDFLVRVAEDPHLHIEEETTTKRLRQDLDHILRLTLEFSMRQSDANAGAIFLADSILDSGVSERKTIQHLVPRVVEGLYPPLQSLTIDYLATRIKYINDLLLSETIDLDNSPFYRRMVEEGRLVYLPETEGVEDLPQQPKDFLRIHTLIAVPLRVQDQVLGLLVVINKTSEKDRGWDPFTPQDASLLNAVGDQAAIAITNARMHEVISEQERLERQIEIARKVQESLLPDRCPDLEGIEFQAVSKAAQQIGGDYYDFVWIDDHRLAIVVADVAGKGIPGALTMASLRTALRSLAPKAKGAKDLAISLNEFIFEDLKRDVFISCLLGVLDLRERRITMVRAGHEPVLLRRKSEEKVEMISPDGMALGLDSGALFRNHLEETVYTLEPGDLFVFYTDGVTEAMNEKHEEFTLERLVLTLEEADDKALDHFVDHIQGVIADFSGGLPPHDDVTMITLRVPPGSGDFRD
ncbi:MAG: SpoIIE family protein phosphatase [Candidatus Omnitrophica bacterium]|nr:SpoIIE family protein phosphatase [Candidatus Omnitrophota bacterium]